MARWHSCNVLDASAETRHIWQFDARNGQNGQLSLNREQPAQAGEPLPSNLVAKSWVSLFQRKLNVAWLPPEHVFFRVAQFPMSTPDETRAMVELQLEKLSPIPVTQALWTMHVLPHAGGNMQTVVVTIVERTVVEEFLGQLEEQGFMADRLELPMLDQLQASNVREDGAWIYSEPQEGNSMALVAWWYGGVLQNIDLLRLTSGPERIGALRDQLMQMAWAGELEGWLTSPPRWHLVSDGGKAAEWEPLLREALDQPIAVETPLSRVELAALTARRATQPDAGSGLLPAEFAARYQQRFYDRLWMRGLVALLVVYGISLVVYFVALNVLNYKTKIVERNAASMGGAYTNALQLKARLQILKDRQELKFAALECWEKVAELMPSSMTLNRMAFSDGRRLSLQGTATDPKEILDFGDNLRRAPKDDHPGELLFENSGGVPTQVSTGGGIVTWTYELFLKRSEAR